MSEDRELLEKAARAVWRAVDCPHCNAIAGEPCNTPAKHPKSGEWPYKAVRPHAIRRRAAASLADRSAGDNTKELG